MHYVVATAEPYTPKMQSYWDLLVNNGEVAITEERENLRLCTHRRIGLIEPFKM